MPLRFLIYIARVYEKITDNKALYKEKLTRIPTPEFYVLYNGKADFPKEETLKLSDAFIEIGKSLSLELEVKVININYGKASEVLEKSHTLKDYSYFVHSVNQYRADGKLLEEAVQFAVKNCIEQNILKNFLELHGTEVVNMLTTEWKLEDALEVKWEEGREDGLEKGLEDGLEKGLEKGLKQKSIEVAKRLLSASQDIPFVMDITGLTEEEIKQLQLGHN